MMISGWRSLRRTGVRCHRRTAPGTGCAPYSLTWTTVWMTTSVGWSRSGTRYSGPESTPHRTKSLLNWTGRSGNPSLRKKPMHYSSTPTSTQYKELYWHDYKKNIIAIRQCYSLGRVMPLILASLLTLNYSQNRGFCEIVELVELYSVGMIISLLVTRFYWYDVLSRLED